jgi:hypothetical protein
MFEHPEANEGEIFLINSNEKVFNEMPWNTKRQGAVALDGNGLMTESIDWFPVFISRMELRNSGKDIKEVRRELRKKLSGMTIVLK